jgi:DNA modification methylase
MRKSPTAARQAKAAPPPPTPNLVKPIEQRFGPIEHWPLERLLPFAQNPRKHPERQIVQLAASIAEFGFVVPALVDEAGSVITGHARLEAARRLGMTELPVIVARCWSKAQVQAYRLADNRLAELGSWDADLLRINIEAIVEIGEVPLEMMGWSTGEIDVILAGTDDEEGEGDLVTEVPVHPVAQAGDLWRLGQHRLLCGSSLEPESWTRLMAGRVGAMCLSDGPFNVPINGHVSGSGRHAEFAMASGEMSEGEFTAFNTQWLNAAKTVLKDGAIVMAFMDHHHLYQLMTAAREAGLKHLNLCVWSKTNAGMGSLYRSQHELVLVLKHGTAPHTNCVELGRHGRHRSNVWVQAGANSFGALRDADLADHPTVKPVALLAEAIRDVTRQGEIVIDAFSGSGSTILACERTKRVGCAIEIEPRYIDVAIRRWEAATGKQATLDDTDETFADVRAARGIPA